jgi:hypothetical protein
MASVHLRKEALADPSLLSRLERHFDRLPHVSEVFDEAEQAGLRMSPVMGELVIEPKPGWTIGPKAPPTPDGQHGTTFERSVPLLLAGSGVLPGAPPRSPQHVDIAPTLAHLLGVPAPSGAQGRVLAEALAGG